MHIKLNDFAEYLLQKYLFEKRINGNYHTRDEEWEDYLIKLAKRYDLHETTFLEKEPTPENVSLFCCMRFFFSLLEKYLHNTKGTETERLKSAVNEIKRLIG